MINKVGGEMSKNKLKHWVASLPKVELHLHIEGSLEPDLMMALAEKHQLELQYANIEDVKNAYNFEDLDEINHLIDNSEQTINFIDLFKKIHKY